MYVPEVARYIAASMKSVPVGLISGHEQHSPNISFVDWYCLMVSRVIHTGLQVGLYSGQHSEQKHFWVLNIRHLTMMPPACQNVGYIAKVCPKNEYSSEGRSLDKVV